MTDHISLVGIVGSDPRHIVASTGRPIASFRLATSVRRMNPDTNEWETTQTNWYTVTCFDRVAENIADRITKGSRILVMGRLRLREYRRENGSTGIDPEVVAAAIGPDLARLGGERRESGDAVGATAASSAASEEPRVGEGPLDRSSEWAPPMQDVSGARAFPQGAAFGGVPAAPPGTEDAAVRSAVGADAGLRGVEPVGADAVDAPF